MIVIELWATLYMDQICQEKSAILQLVFKHLRLENLKHAKNFEFKQYI